MKYFLIVLLLVIGFACIYVSKGYSDDKQDLINEYKMLEQRLNQAQKAMVTLERRMVEIQGALKYLDKKEKEIKAIEEAKAKEEAKKIEETKPKEEE